MFDWALNTPLNFTPDLSTLVLIFASEVYFWNNTNDTATYLKINVFEGELSSVSFIKR